MRREHHAEAIARTRKADGFRESSTPVSGDGTEGTWNGTDPVKDAHHGRLSTYAGPPNPLSWPAAHANLGSPRASCCSFRGPPWARDRVCCRAWSPTPEARR